MGDTLEHKYLAIKDSIKPQHPPYQDAQFKGIKLEGLRYTNDDSYTVRFNKECLPGSEYLILINKIMEDKQLNYCLLEDASKIDMPKDILEQLRLKIRADHDNTLSVD